MMFLIQTSRGSLQTMFQPIGTLCKFCKIQVTQLNWWLRRNILVTFIRRNPWTNTQNNKLSQICVNDIRHCVMCTRLSHRWKRLMLGLQPFNVGGVLSGLLMKLDFKSWRIGLFLTFLCYAMRRVYETCQVLNTLSHPSFYPILVTSSKNSIT